MKGTGQGVADAKRQTNRSAESQGKINDSSDEFSVQADHWHGLLAVAFNRSAQGPFHSDPTVGGDEPKIHGRLSTQSCQKAKAL